MKQIVCSWSHLSFIIPSSHTLLGEISGSYGELLWVKWETGKLHSHDRIMHHPSGRASLPVAPTALLARDRFFPLLFFLLLHHRRNHHYYYRPRPHRHHDGVQRSPMELVTACVSVHQWARSCALPSREQSTWIGLRLADLSVYSDRIKSDCSIETGNFLLTVTTATLKSSRVTRFLGRRILSKKCELPWERDLKRNAIKRTAMTMSLFREPRNWMVPTAELSRLC